MGRSGIYLAIALGSVLVAYSDLVGAARIPIYRDLLPFVYPYRWFLAEQLAEGRLPLWNPYVHLGVPFLASLHASALYPPSLLLLVPFPLGFNVFLLAHYLLAIAGIAVLLRDRGLGPAPVAVGAIVFTVGGYLVSSLTNTAHLQTAVWLPWVVLAWDRYHRQRGGGALLATVSLLALQLCAGAPEVWMLTVALLAARSLSHGGPGLFPRLGFAGRFGVLVALSMLLAAVQLVPTFEYVSQSRRISALDWAEATSWSLEPVSLLQFLFPHSSALVGGYETGTLGTYLETTPPLVHSLYVGIFGLLLAIVGVVTSRERYFWGAVAVGTVLFALGPGSPVFDGFRALLPMVVGRIRYPEKVLVLLHLALTILAAHGAAEIFERRGPAVRVSVVAAVVIALATGAVLLLGFLDPGRLTWLSSVLTGRGDLPPGAFRLLAVDLLYKAERSFLLIVLWAGIVLLYRYGRLRAALAAPLVVLILAVDLTSAHRNLALSVGTEALAEAPLVVDVAELRRERGRVFNYQRQFAGESVPGLARHHPEIYTRTDLREFAIDQWRTLFLDLGMVHGVGTLSGFDSIGEPMLLWGAVGGLPLDHAIRLLGVFGVRALIGRDALGSAEVEQAEVPEADGVYVHRVRKALPFAFLVPELEVVSGEEAAFARLGEAAFPRERRALVERLPAGWTDGPPLAPGEGVVVEAAAPHAITLAVSGRGPRLLVVNERHFPGWVAEIDGQDAEIHRTNGLVRGVVVPAGRHRVRFRYEPRSLLVGFLISLVTGTALLGAVGFRRRRRQRQRSRHA